MAQYQLYLGNPNKYPTANGTISIWDNDAVVAFLRQNGYHKQYNDGLYQYLKVVFLYDNPVGTLNDLLHRYIKLYGTTI